VQPVTATAARTNVLMARAERMAAPPEDA
jgi:hypothetical protein